MLYARADPEIEEGKGTRVEIAAWLVVRIAYSIVGGSGGVLPRKNFERASEAIRDCGTIYSFQ